MKGFIKRGAVIVAAGMLLTGCGEELTKLTASEEALIVNYSAGVVGKYNRYQQDGMTAVVSQETEEKEQQKEIDKKGSSNQEEETDLNENISKGDTPKEGKRMKLTDILAIPGVEIKYEGYDVSKSYKENNSQVINASDGRTYFIMKAKVTNTGSEDIDCDILGKNPVFTLSLNGAAFVKNQVTELSNDLSTYKKDIAAGASKDAVLIFEVSEKEAANITSAEVGVRINENLSK